MKSKTVFEYVFVGVVLSFAFWLRFHVSNINFFQDEVYTALAAKGILETGVPKMVSGLMYVRAFPFTYLAAFFGSFHFSESNLRLASELVGIISLCIFYRTLKRHIDRKSAFVGIIVLSVSPWHGLYSIFLRSFLLQALLFYLVVYAYFELLEREHVIALRMSIVWTVLLALLSPIVILLVPINLFVLWYYPKTRKHIALFGILSAISVLSFFLPSVIPAWVVPVENNSYSLWRIRDVILPNIYFWKTFLNWFPVGMFALIGSGLYAWRKKKNWLVFPVFMLGSFLLLSIVNPFMNLQPRYLSNFLLVYYFTVFMCIAGIIKEKLNTRIPLVYIVLLFLLVSDVFYLGQFVSLRVGSPTEKTLQVSESWDSIPDIKSAVEYVNTHAESKDIVISLQPKGQTEVYSQRLPNYILRTQEVVSECHIVDGACIDDYSNIELITSGNQLETIVTTAKAQGKTIWVISSKSELVDLNHIDVGTKNILVKHGKIVYTGLDSFSKVYLIR